MSWSHIQHVRGGDVTGTTFTTFSITISATTAGSVVSGIVIWQEVNPTVGLTSVTTDKGDTATLLDHTSDNIGNDEGTTSFVFLNPTAGATVITATFNTNPAAFLGIEIDEDTFGAGNTYSVDGHTGVFQATPSIGANTINSGSITPATNGDLIKGFCVNSGGGPTYSAGTSPNAFTIRNPGTPVDFSFFSEDFIQTTAASIAATMGINGTAASNSFVVALKATAGGGDTFANTGRIFFI